MLRRLLLSLAALAAAVFVPAAIAAPPAAHTVRGTIIAKDRAHNAVVLALPGGGVQAVVVPGSLARVTVGRKVVARTTVVAGSLATATRVAMNGKAHRALVRGTIVRIAKRRVVLNAGGTILAVTLAPTRKTRTTASARSGPKAGDVVKAEVEIDDDGSLDAEHVVVVASAAGATSAGEMEVRGKVTTLLPATADAAGAITVDAMGLVVSCVIPAGHVIAVEVGTMIELECNAVGSPAVWTVRGAHDEDEHATVGDDDESGASAEHDDDDDENADAEDDDGHEQGDDDDEDNHGSGD